MWEKKLELLICSDRSRLRARRIATRLTEEGVKNILLSPSGEENGITLSFMRSGTLFSVDVDDEDVIVGIRDPDGNIRILTDEETTVFETLAEDLT